MSSTYNDLSNKNISSKNILAFFSYDKIITYNDISTYTHTEPGFTGIRIRCDLSEKTESIIAKNVEIEFDDEATTPANLTGTKYFIYNRYIYVKKTSWLAGEELTVRIKKYFSDSYLKIKSEIVSGDTIICEPRLQNISSSKNGVKVNEIGTITTTYMTLNFINDDYFMNQYTKLKNKECTVYSIIDQNEIDYSTVKKLFEGTITSYNFWNEKATLRIETQDIYKTQKTEDSSNKDLMIFGRVENLKVDNKFKKEEYILIEENIDARFIPGGPVDKVLSVFYIDDYEDISLVKKIKPGDKICIESKHTGKKYFGNVTGNPANFVEEFITDISFYDFEYEFGEGEVKLFIHSENYQENFEKFQISSLPQLRNWNGASKYLSLFVGDKSITPDVNYIDFNQDLSFLKRDDVVIVEYDPDPAYPSYTPSIKVSQEMRVREIDNNRIYFDQKFSAPLALYSTFEMQIPRVQKVNNKKNERPKIQVTNLFLENIRTSGVCSYITFEINSQKYNLIFATSSQTIPTLTGTNVIIGMDSVTTQEELIFSLISSCSAHRDYFICSSTTYDSGTNSQILIQYLFPADTFGEIQVTNFLTVNSSVSIYYSQTNNLNYDYDFAENETYITIDQKQLTQLERQDIAIINYSASVVTRGSNASPGSAVLKNKRRILINDPNAFTPGVNSYLKISPNSIYGFDKIYKVLEVSNQGSYCEIFIDEKISYSTSACTIMFYAEQERIKELEIDIISTIPHYSNIVKDFAYYLNIPNISQDDLDTIKTNEPKLFCGFAEKSKESFAKILNKLNTSIAAYTFLQGNTLRFKRFSFLNLQEKTAIAEIKPTDLISGDVDFAYINTTQYKNLYYKYLYSYNNESYNANIHLQNELNLGEKKELDTFFIGEEAIAQAKAEELYPLFFEDIIELTLKSNLKFLQYNLFDIIELKGFKNAPNQKYIIGSIETNGNDSIIKIYTKLQ